MRNLHPGANLHPGCKFAPGVYFLPCERCLKNLHPGVNLHPGANLLLPSRWSKFICTRVQIVLMNANCIISMHLMGDFDKWQAFSITMLFKID